MCCTGVHCMENSYKTCFVHLVDDIEDKNQQLLLKCSVYFISDL